MIVAMRGKARLGLIALFALVTAANAAVAPWMETMRGATGDIDQWQRVDFRASGLSRQNAAQIKVVIRTKGPSMQGLIRIPGAPASNFDTGKGTTIVDLINVGNNSNGYADIVALEILFTQTMPGQFYEVFAVENEEKAKWRPRLVPGALLGDRPFQGGNP